MYASFFIQFFIFFSFRHVLDVIAGIKAQSESIEDYKKNLADQIYENTKKVFFPSTTEMD